MSSKQRRSALYRPGMYFTIAIVFAILYTLLSYYSKNIAEDKNVVSNIKSIISEKHQHLENKTLNIQKILQSQGVYWPGLEKVVDSKGLFAQVFKTDSLIFWNSNQIPTGFAATEVEGFNIIANQNGWYTAHYTSYNNYKIVLYELLKSKVSIGEVSQPVTTSKGYVNCKNIQFTNDPALSNYTIYADDGRLIIGMYVNGISEINDQVILILFLVYFLTYVFVILWIASLYKFFKKYFKNEQVVFIFFLFDLLIVRLIEYYFDFPYLVKNSSFFADQFDIFISFNSAGDILINSLIILSIAIQLIRTPALFVIDKKQMTAKSISITVILLLYTLFVFSILYSVITTLPYNSFYGFNIQQQNVIICLVSLVFLVASLFLVIQSIVEKINGLLRTVIIPLGLTFILTIIWFFIFKYEIFIAVVSIIFIALIVIINKHLPVKRSHSFYKYLLLIIVFAAATSIVVNKARLTIKDNHQYATLNVLSISNDKLVENAFNDFDDKMPHDTAVVKYLKDSTQRLKQGFEEYLKKTYFFQVSKQYNIQLTICEPDEPLEIKPENIITDCSDYFDSFINEVDHEKADSNLYLISDIPGSIYYFGKKSINGYGKQIDIYLEFFFTYIPEGLGYPELLVKHADREVDLSGYSFARYRKGQLVNKFGEFTYLTSLTEMDKFNDDKLFQLHSSTHIKHKTSNDNYIVISRPNENVSVQLVTFSALFVIYLVLILTIVLLLFGKRAIVLIRESFQSRLQVIFLSTISLIIILLAIITLFYINIDNNNRIEEQLSEKTNSVIIELQHKLGDNENFYNIDEVELEYLLKKFSLVFFSDINLYNPNGELISTSRPEMYDRGLLSKMVNPMAFEELFIKNKLSYITQENIGNTTYYSSYAPIMLRGDKPAGIINLPYFAKQSEVNMSYNLMIYTFINLFVILGIVGTIIAILLSRIITRPLAVLQENLSTIQIDKRNEIIKWKGHDEIGQLISAYNEMIEKLEQSTELLKQSERESAWREVAQQIAHEIKNPLTPMKLNIQYLEKAFNEKDPDLDEKVKNISELLINQIETLNKVAEMFSDFTKLKTGKFQKVDLVKVINDTVKLYLRHSDVVFDFNKEPDRQYFTGAFEKDLSRLFTNLAKNAIHSLENNKNGKITIEIESSRNFHHVTFTDNGKGIPDEAKANIFQPYFTTKSKGTGLGLAIVKNIMNEIGGEITFESRLGFGTSFKLKFPAFKQ